MLRDAIVHVADEDIDFLTKHVTGAEVVPAGNKDPGRVSLWPTIWPSPGR